MAIRMEWLVVEAKHLSHILHIRVQHHQVPLAIVLGIIEVGHRDLHAPVLRVAFFHMPMNSYWAHKMCALYHWLRSYFIW